jgi:hypothetical protein
MSKVVPGPNFFFDRDRDQDQKFFWLGSASKFFLNKTETKMFFFRPGPWPKYFWLGPARKFASEGTRTGTKNFFSPGPGPKMTGPIHVYLQVSQADLNLESRGARFGFPGTRERKLDYGFRVHGNPETIKNFRENIIKVCVDFQSSQKQIWKWVPVPKEREG